MELWHLVVVCGRLLWVGLQLKKERGRWVGKSKEKLEPARMRWDPYDRLTPTSPTAPNFSDESGLQVKLSPVAQSWTLNPGTGAGGVVSQAPARIDRRASREQCHGWAKGSRSPAPIHLLSLRKIAAASPFQVWHVNALRDDTDSQGTLREGNSGNIYLNSPISEAVFFSEGFQQQSQFFFTDAWPKVVYFLTELRTLYLLRSVSISSN